MTFQLALIEDVCNGGFEELWVPESASRRESRGDDAKSTTRSGINEKRAFKRKGELIPENESVCENGQCFLLFTSRQERCNLIGGILVQGKFGSSHK